MFNNKLLQTQFMKQQIFFFKLKRSQRHVYHEDLWKMRKKILFLQIWIYALMFAL
jgi:hypothetical protein